MKINLDEYPNVYWIAARNHVRCTWWDSKKKSWKVRSQHVEFEEGDGPDEKVDAVFEAAAELQSFFETNHDTLNNMDAEEDDSECERPAKISKCEDTIG